MIYILLLLLLLFGLSFPMWRMLWERWVWIRRFKKICATRQFLLIRVKKKYNKQSLKKEKADYYVDTGINLYAIRIYGMLHKNATAVFHEDHRVTVRRKMSRVFRENDADKTTVSETPMGMIAPVRIPRRLCEERSVYPILILAPACRSVLYQKGSEVVSCKNGDVLYGMKLFSTEAFARILSDLI